MVSIRWALVFGLLVVVCLSQQSRAEDAKAEPEPGAEPEAEAEPGKDEDKAGGSAGKAGESKASTGGKNPASAPWAFSVPAIMSFVFVAKYII